MARARNIKPGFFENELLIDLSPLDRLLFIGLWCLADREGRIEDRERRIKMKLFPGDDYNVGVGLANLARSRFISRYSACGIDVIEVCNFAKHQKPHGTEKDSQLPDREGFLKVNGRVKNCVDGKFTLVKCEITLNNVDSPSYNALIPDSLIHRLTDSLIPDSPNPDSLNPEKIKNITDETSSPAGGELVLFADEPPTKKTRKPRKPKAEDDEEVQAQCRSIWNAYANAYQDRYHTAPVRNQKVNSQVKQMLGRIPADEAPDVAAYYVSINDVQYIRNCHDVGTLLAKIEAIRTQWATNLKINGTTARQMESTQANLNAALGAKEIIRRNDANPFLKRH